MVLPPGLFITGTDTGVGKTHMACGVVMALVREGRRVGIIKPVSAGGTEDAACLIAALGRPVSLDLVNPIRLAEPLAPPVAARRAGVSLTFEEVVNATTRSIAEFGSSIEVMVIEGVGGLLCPLTDGTTVADLAAYFDYPLIVVARRGLGTLNHTLLTLEAAQTRGLRVAGLILNGSEPTISVIAEQSAAEELSRRIGPIPILAEVVHGAVLDSHQSLDWFGRASVPRRER